MNDDGGGLVVDFEVLGAHSEAIVGVFVVRGAKADVKAADVRKQRSWRCEQRTGAVVHLTYEGKDRRILVRLATTDIEPRAVGKDGSPGFLNAAVRPQELPTYHPSVLVRTERVRECLEPARLRQRVIVQKDQRVATRLIGAAVTSVDEA